MDIRQRLQPTFDRIDTNRNGVSVQELKTLDQDQNGELSATEASAAGIHTPEDVSTLNQALGRARSNNMEPSEILFPRPGATRSLPGPPSDTDRLSYRAFDPNDASLSRRLTRLDMSTLGGGAYVNGGNAQVIGAPAAGSVATISTDETGAGANINSFETLRNASQDAVRTQLGGNPSDADIQSYINANGEGMAQQLGSDLNGKYSNFTSVGFLGDVGTFTPFQGSADNDIIVCTNIHAAVAAFRQEVLGQEAYVIASNSDDQAHIITAFKDNQSGTWNLQNYGTVVRTDAKDIRELYEKYLPDQRHITLGSVDEKGINSERDVRTTLGEREHRFRTQLGAGNHDPLNPTNEMSLGTNNIGGSVGGFNLSFDPRTTTAALNYHWKEGDDQNRTIRGMAAEIQDHTTEGGFQRQRIDAKYESENVRTTQHSPGHESVRREYFNVHAGIEDTNQNAPIFGSDSDTGAAARVGASYSVGASHLFGTGPLRFELSPEFNVGLTATVATKGEDFYARYVNRMLGDGILEGQTGLGLHYQNDGLLIRGGITPRLDVANLNGFADAGKQFSNMFELDAYGEMQYQTDRGRFGVMGTADLRHPGVFQVGAMADINLTRNLSWTTLVNHQNDPLLGNRSGFQSGLTFKPQSNLSIFGGYGSTLDGMQNVNAGIRASF